MINTIFITNGDQTMEVNEPERKRAICISFADLYKQYYGRVYSICLRMTSNKAEAEDCGKFFAIAKNYQLEIGRSLY